MKNSEPFQTLLFKISTDFINLPEEQIDNAIEKSQRLVCEQLGFDFSAIWELSPDDDRFLYLTHIHMPPGLPPVPNKMEAEATHPWVLRELKSGRVVALKTKDAPKEAAKDQEVWRRYGVKSVLAIPLLAGGDDLLIGVFSVGTIDKERDWAKSLIKQMELLAQVYANAIVRKRADHALQESEARLKLATEAAGAGLWIMKTETKEVWVSDKMRELFHFLPHEKVTYERFFTLIHPDDHAHVHKAVERALETGKNLLSEYRIVRPDGSIRWIGARGRRYGDSEPFRLMGASMDITDRKEMEKQIRNAADDWRKTFDSSQDIIMILDRDLKVCRHNTAATELLGRSSSEILGRHCHELMHESREPSPDCSVRKSFETGEHHEEECYNVNRGKWYQISSDPIQDNEGNVNRIVHRIKDITERMQAEEKARKQWEQLAHVTRMGIMGELTASLAHEINQPLTAIQSNAEAARRFLAADNADLNEVRQIFEDISTDNERAGNILSKVRAMLKNETIPFILLNMNEVIADVLSLLRPQSLLQNMRIETDFCSEIPLIYGDRIQLQQVMINLILNGAAAMKKTPGERRRLVIRTGIHGESNVKVSVRDFGHGINEQKVDSIFEPFFTTKPHGMGMGLPISKTIIGGHGGLMWASSHSKWGAVFAFTLPVHSGDKT